MSPRVHYNSNSTHFHRSEYINCQIYCEFLDENFLLTGLCKTDGDDKLFLLQR